MIRRLQFGISSSPLQKSREGENEDSCPKSRREAAGNTSIFNVSQRRIRVRRPFAARVRVLQRAACVLALIIGAQSFSSPLETPCGGTVAHGHISPELTTTQKNFVIAWENIYFPYAIRLADPTYNCHSFAFSGGHGWINDPAVYIDSYEVDWEGDVVTYFNCITMAPSHSAIVSPSDGLAISKWGYGSLMKHAWNYVPNEYGMYQGVYKRTSGCTTNYDCM